MTTSLTDLGGDEAAGSDLQPRAFNPDRSNLLELSSALRTIEDRHASEQLESVIGDEAVMLHLQLVHYDTATPEWAVFQNALIEYGYSVFVAWGIAGVLRAKVAAHGKGRGVRGQGKIPEAHKLSPDDAHILAVELMYVSIEQFRIKTLLADDPAKRWSPTGGASIKTYFIGRCLLELPEVFNRLRRERELVPLLNPGEHLREHVAAAPELTPHAQLERRIEIDETFGGARVTQVMFELHTAGFTAAEIAELLSDRGHIIRPGTVWSTISRFRAQVAGGT